MIVLSSLVGTPESAPVRALLAARRQAGEDELRARIARGQGEGDVPAEADPAQLAAFYSTILQGMSVAARDGADRARLDGIVANAMACWPAGRAGTDG